MNTHSHSFSCVAPATCYMYRTISNTELAGDLPPAFGNLSGIYFMWVQFSVIILSRLGLLPDVVEFMEIAFTFDQYMPSNFFWIGRSLTLSLTLDLWGTQLHHRKLETDRAYSKGTWTAPKSWSAVSALIKTFSIYLNIWILFFLSFWTTSETLILSIMLSPLWSASLGIEFWMHPCKFFCKHMHLMS